MSCPQKFVLAQLAVSILREGLKKNWEKAVRLTAWVDPPSPSSGQENVNKFDFDFRLWFLIIYDL